MCNTKNKKNTLFFLPVPNPIPPIKMKKRLKKKLMISFGVLAPTMIKKKK
jgi:hypothetical protein